MVTNVEATLLQRAAATLQVADEVVATYDRASDTLMLHFFGHPRAAVSIPIEGGEDSLYIRLDRASDEIVGIQIEGFTADFIPRHPELADTLEVTDAPGNGRLERARDDARRNRSRHIQSRMVRFLESRMDK